MNFTNRLSRARLLMCARTGATGYIGGDALYALAHAHPELTITALVRDSDKGARVVQQHPTIRLIEGDLDSSEVIERESADADIVLSEIGESALH
jgi:N-acetyl-gamma-glutamylphosphate reductase